MALFQLSFFVCVCVWGGGGGGGGVEVGGGEYRVKILFPLNNFEGMHWLHWKFAEWYILIA